LLKANAIEAISELRKDQKFDPATAENVRIFLAEAESSKGFRTSGDRTN
jgi:hypothetical protein